MPFVTRIQFVCVFLSLALFYSCSAVSQVKESPEKEVLRFGTLNFMSGGIIAVGKEKGFFLKQGLDVEVSTFDSAQKVTLAVASGAVDIGQGGITAAAYNLGSRHQLKIIRGSTRDIKGWPGSAYVVSNTLWNKGVRRPSQLKGMKIGIPDIGSTPHYIAGMLADEYGWALGKDIQLVPLGSVMAMKAGLYNGSIDWSVFPGNIAHRMESEKIAHVIGHVGEETPWQVSAIMASMNTLQNKRHVLKRFLAAHFETIQYYRQLFMVPSAKETRLSAIDYTTGRDQVAEIISRFVLPAVSKKEVLDFPVYLDSHGELDLNSLKKQLEWFKKQGMVSDRIQVNDVIASEYVTFLDDKVGE